MKKLNIALVAHDARKSELCDWVKWNKVPLSQHNLFATGTTARVVSESCGNEVHALLSGPLGGDQQIGSMIAEGKIDILIFFCDNLITQGHQQDVGALVRLASLYNIGFATNRTICFLHHHYSVVKTMIESFPNLFITTHIDLIVTLMRLRN